MCRFINGFNCKQIDVENSRLESIDGYIPFGQLVVCTNGFTSKLLPQIEFKPARNQVILTKPIKDFKLGPCYHMHKGYVYFREINGRLLLGGGRHLNFEGETTDENGTTEQIQDYLRNLIKDVLIPNKNIEIERSWSGILGVSEDKIPIVRKVSENIHIAAKMGGMGVAIGSFIGKVVSSMIISDDNSDLQLYVS